jgi:hypothetical protein
MFKQSVSDLMVMCSEHLHVWKHIYFGLLNVAVWRYNKNLMTSTTRYSSFVQYNPVLRTSIIYLNELWIECFHCFPVAQQLKSGQNRLSVEVSRSHTAENWTIISASRMLLPTQNTTQETNVHVLCGIRIRNPSNREAANLRRRPHGHRDGVQCLVSCPTGFLVCDSTTVGVSFGNKAFFMAWPQQTSALVFKRMVGSYMRSYTCRSYIQTSGYFNVPFVNPLCII